MAKIDQMTASMLQSNVITSFDEQNQSRFDQMLIAMPLNNDENLETPSTPTKTLNHFKWLNTQRNQIDNTISFILISTVTPLNIPRSIIQEICTKNEEKQMETIKLKQQIKNLEQKNKSLAEAAGESEVLVVEVAERHDLIVKLKNEINELEQQLKQKDTHIQFKEEIIKKLRSKQQTPFKINSVQKVVDLIRNERSNAFNDETVNHLGVSLQSIHIENERTEQIKSQQAKIDTLNSQLEKMRINYDEIEQKYEIVQQKFETIAQKELDEKNASQVEMNCPVEGSEFSTAIADKTHLANLITSLKSELSSANAVIKAKENDLIDCKRHSEQTQLELENAKKRIELLEKQCENYRQTIKHLEENLTMHSDTIDQLQEHQSKMKSQIIESQEKQQNVLKLMDEKRKIESERKHQLTTIKFLRTALEDRIKAEKTSAKSNLINQLTLSENGRSSNCSSTTATNPKWNFFK